MSISLNNNIVNNQFNKLNFKGKEKANNPEHKHVSKWDQLKSKATGYATAGLLGSLTVGPMVLTSCEKTEVSAPVNIVINLTEVENLLKEILAAQNLTNDKLDKQTKLMNDVLTLITEFKQQSHEDHEITNGILWQIVDKLDEMFQNDKEFQARIEKIMNDKNKSDEARYNAIIAELQKQNQALQDIKTIIKENGDKVTGNQELLEQWYQDYLDGKKTMSELVTNILNEAIANNADNKEVISQLQEIKDKIASGQYDPSTALDAIKDILEHIDGQVTEINGKLDQIIQNQEKQFASFGEKLDNIYNGIGDINSKLDDLITQGDLLIQSNNKIASNGDRLIEIGDSLLNQGEKQITKEDLEQIFGGRLDEMLAKLGIIGDKIDIDKFVEALQFLKTDLSKTNELIQGVISTIKNASMGGMTQEQLDELKQLLSDVNQSIQAGNTNVNDKLEQIIAIGNTQTGILQEISSKLDAALAKYDQYSQKADENALKIFEKFDTAIEEIKNNRFDPTKLNEYIDESKQYFSDMRNNVIMLKSGQDQTNDLLQKLLDANGGSMTKADLIEALAPVIGGIDTANTFLENLGFKGDSVIVAIDNLGQKVDSNKTDLSKTNELINGSITWLKNISNLLQGGSGAGGVDTAQLESIMTQILTEMQSGSLANTENQKALQDKLDALNQELVNIKNQLTASQGGTV